MKSMKIAASSELVSRLSSHRQVVSLDSTDFTDVAAVVITVADSRSGILALLKRTGFHIPVFLFAESDVDLPAGVNAVIRGQAQDWLELESAACQYEEDLLPPFYDTLTQYVEMGNSTFACPGHQHGEFFKKHPAGRHFYEFFGENLFRADMCNADVKLGDLLIHEGSAKHAQKFAAKVFHADKTYFVLNGTSAANKVVTNALLTRGDLVLFEDWPEFAAVYNAGGFSGMVLPYNADSATIAANLGKFRPNAANPTGLYLPSCGEQFFRGWTGGSRTAGSAQEDAIRNIAGKLGETIHTELFDGAFYIGSTTGTRSYPEGGYTAGFPFLDASRVVPTANENRPANVALPVALYIGLPA